MSGPRMKGAAVREFLRWYARERSHDVLRDAVASLSPAAQRVFDVESDGLGILPSTWYDCATLHELLDELLARTPEHEREAMMREGARHAIEQSIRGIYRFVLVQLTPELYVRQIQRLWGMVHDTGSREIVMLSRTSCRSFTRDWAGHHPVLCTATTEAMAAVLEILGCKETRVERIACVSRGDPECVADVHWTSR